MLPHSLFTYSNSWDASSESETSTALRVLVTLGPLVDFDLIPMLSLTTPIHHFYNNTVDTGDECLPFIVGRLLSFFVLWYVEDECLAGVRTRESQSSYT